MKHDKHKEEKHKEKDKDKDKFKEKDHEKREEKKEDKEVKIKKREEYNHIDHGDEIKRLNRVVGQIDGIRKMLEEQRKLEDVLMQCKAIHSALRSVEARILKAHLEVALDEVVKLDKKKSRAEKVAQLEELFKHAS